MYHKDNLSIMDVNCIFQRIKDVSLQKWLSDIESLPKLDSYRIFKSNLEFEKYFDIVVNERDRICLTRLRCSAHRLLIEEGRFRNIPRNERICTRCNMGVIENEYHFLLICSLYRGLWKAYFPKYFLRWPSTFKFKQLLSSFKRTTTKNLAKFTRLAFDLRASRD